MRQFNFNNNFICLKAIYLIILLCLFNNISVFSQEKDNYRRISVTGKVFDIESLDSLPYSNIIINKKQSLMTDSKGYFNVNLLIKDTIAISHLGYITSKIVLLDLITKYDSIHINVLMKEQIYDIPEVSVFPFKSYGEFKRAILNNNTNNQELSNAYENIKMLKTQIQNGYIPDNDSRTSYSYLINYKNSNTNSIVLFSSPPNKGIVPAIKKILKR